MYNNRPCYPVVIPNGYNDQHQELPVTPPHVTSLLLPMSLSPPSPTPSMSSTSSDEQPPSPENTDDTSPEKVTRTRISFTTSQQADLEGEFQKSAYLHKTRRVEIAKRLELEEKHIKVWFQNRRMKSKRENAAKSAVKPQQSENENKPTRSTASPKPVRKDTLLQKVLRKNAAATQVAAKKSQSIIHNGNFTLGNLYNNLSHIPLSVNQGKAYNASEQQYRLVLLPQQPHQRLQQFPFQYVLPQQWRHTQQFYPPSALTQQQEVMMGAQHYLPFQQTKTSDSVHRSIGINTQSFDDMKSFHLSDQEDNIDLDAYFNNTSSSTPSLDVSMDEEEPLNPSKRMKIDEDDFDFNKILDNLVDMPMLSNVMPVNSNPPDSSIERDDFDVDDFINNLDKYVSYPGPKS